MSADAVIALQNLGFAYPGRPALFDNANFSLPAHARIGLHGPNGTGKSTFFRLLVGLETPQTGAVLFHGNAVEGEKAFRQVRRAVGLVMQNADDQLFSPTVLEDVAFGPLNLGLSRAEAVERARQVLQDLDMADMAERLTHRLSGGEKKLVCIASVLAMRPEALLLDEPTAFLDEVSSARMTEILAHLPVARIIISHDRDFLEHNASSFISISNGAFTPPAPHLPPLPGCCRGHQH